MLVLRGGRRAHKIERRFVGDVLTVIDSLTIWTRQIGTRRGDTMTFGRALEFYDDVVLLSRRHAGDVDV